MNLRFEQMSLNEGRIIWKPPEVQNGPIDGYQVEDDRKRLQSSSTKETSINVNELEPCSVYTFQVFAFNKGTDRGIGGGNGPKNRLEFKSALMGEFKPKFKIKKQQKNGDYFITWVNALPKNCMAKYSVYLDNRMMEETENEYIIVYNLEGNKTYSLKIAAAVDEQVILSKYWYFDLPAYVRDLTCTQIEGGIIIECKWREPSQLNGFLKNYFVQVNNGYSTEVKENRILLKDMNGKRFHDSKTYTIHVRGLTVDYGEVTTAQFQTMDGQYSQEVMDDLIYAIGDGLNVNRLNESSLTLNFSEFGQAWSYDLQKITLYILNQTNYLPTDTCLTSEYQDPCQAARESGAQCWEVPLQQEKFSNELFVWRNEDPNLPMLALGMHLQLRFYYKNNPLCWTASEIFEIGYRNSSEK
ncbi:hypothetical protein Ciccas_011548 [Cichlidogyrus casuarinus]|uniref:Fibronectin type-III domain-containing protein n=1 Tax=Cichlidogyrus casuarinus TaxID=1844966 RepID=A0ABD2PQZ1_9PLAT